MPKPQPRVEDDYEIGVQLGSGHFATVHRGRCKRTGVEVAIKIVTKKYGYENSLKVDGTLVGFSDSSLVRFVRFQLTHFVALLGDLLVKVITA